MRTRITRRSGFALACGLALAAFIGAAPARADGTYPDRLIKVVVPFAPGGGVDAIARIVMEQLSTELKQPIVIENRPGANATLGAQAVSQAEPDGYTLLVNASNHVINPLILSKVPYDAERDFTPITQLGYVPLLLVVPAASPARSLADLIAMARAEPGKVMWAIGGRGIAGHLAEEMVKSEAGIDMPVVAYRGGGPAINDVIGGHVAALIEPMSSALPHVRGGLLKALAVTSARRLPELPELPTVAETLPGFEVVSWYGFYGPRNLPRGIVDRLHAGVVRALQAPGVKSKLAGLSISAAGSSPAEFRTFSADETAKYARAVAKAQIKID